MFRAATGAGLALVLLLGAVTGIGAGPTPEKRVTTRTTSLNARLASEQRLRTEVGTEQREVAAATRARLVADAASRSRAAASRTLGRFVVTCYSLRGRTSTGRLVSMEVVAVDPRVVRYGTRISISGVGVRVAADTGPAIRGNRLDIWLPSTEACRQYGRRTATVSLA